MMSPRSMAGENMEKDGVLGFDSRINGSRGLSDKKGVRKEILILW